jgi:hypothetical protein
MSREAVARCVNCHCSDERSCVGGCLWARVDRFSRVGICDRCWANVSAQSILLFRYERAMVKARATAAFV